MEKALTFDDVNIVPNYSDVLTRADCDTHTFFLGAYLSLPIVPANMKTVTGYKMVKEMCNLGTIGILHRFNGWKDDFIEILKDTSITRYAVSVGVNSTYEELMFMYDNIKLYAEHKRPSFIVVDVAHGHHVKVQIAIEHCKTVFSNVPVVAGNIVTPEAAEDLVNWGASAVKVGVGSGCFTPDMEVRTINGNEPIRKISCGDLVYTHTGDLEPVTNIICRDCTEGVILEINGIECTLNHEFYVVKRADADNIKNKNIHNYAFWVRADELTDNLMLVQLEND